MKDSSTSALFEEEIKSILQEYGPLTTAQIYPFIKGKFANLCDDGELDKGNAEVAWKHRVRAAQERLSRKNLIALSASDRRWHSKSVD